MNFGTKSIKGKELCTPSYWLMPVHGFLNFHKMQYKDNTIITIAIHKQEKYTSRHDIMKLQPTVKERLLHVPSISCVIYFSPPVSGLFFVLPLDRVDATGLLPYSRHRRTCTSGRIL